MTIYRTFKKDVSTNETRDILLFVEEYYNGFPYMVKSITDFDYEYFNEANEIRKTLKGYQVFVEYRNKDVKFLDLFILRFLESPLYEIEKQIENSSKLYGKKNEEKEKNKENEEKVIKHRRSKKDILNSYQRAKMIAEQNTSLPPSIPSSDYNEIPKEPFIIPVEPDDDVIKNKNKKYEKEKEVHIEENKIADAIARNKRKMLGLNT